MSNHKSVTLHARFQVFVGREMGRTEGFEVITTRLHVTVGGLEALGEI